MSRHASQLLIVDYLTKWPHDPHNVPAVSLPTGDTSLVFLTIPEAAAMWRIPVRTLRRWVANAGLTQHPGQRYTVDDLADLAEARATRARPPALTL